MSIEKLATLSPRERQVLGLRCDGLDYKTIGQELHIAVPTVKYDMGRIYLKLGLDQLPTTERLKIILEVYCPLLHEQALPPGPVDDQGQSPVPGNIVAMVERDETALVSQQRGYVMAHQPPMITVREPPPRTGSGRTLLWVAGCIGIGILTILMLGTGVCVGLTMGRGGQTPVRSASSTPFVQVKEVTVVVTANPSPVEPTVTPVVEEVVEVTATSLPATAPPTAPPLPTVALPFQDTFDQGLRPEWRIVSGQPIFVNGRLETGSYAGGLTLQIGDGTLGDYTVSAFASRCNGGESSVTVTIAERVQFIFPSAYGTFLWKAFQDNKWIYLPEGPRIGCTGNIRVTVAGNAYTAAFDNAVILEGRYGNPVHGPLTLALGDNVAIDNFSLTSP